MHVGDSGRTERMYGLKCKNCEIQQSHTRMHTSGISLHPYRVRIAPAAAGKVGPS